MAINYKIIWLTSAAEIKEVEDFYSQFTNDQKNDLKFEFTTDRFIKICDEQNTIIGFGSVNVSKTSYTDLRRFIHPEFRGKQIAEHLLDKIIESAISENISKIRGTFKSENIKAKEFLERKGFKIIDSGIKFYNQKFSTATLKL